MINLLSKLIIEKVYSAATVYSTQGTTKKRINRACWAIIFKYEGETIYNCEGEIAISNINNVVVIPKGCSFKWTCVKSGHYGIIEFESSLILNKIIQLEVPNGDEILKIIKKLEYKRMLKKPMCELESIRDVYTLILKLTELSNKQYVSSEKAKKLIPAMEFILKNYTATLNNDHLASLTGFSTVYFRKLFKEVNGISPLMYAKKLRIKKAKEMLRGNFESISDIATSLGYQSIYDFSRDFKKHTGMSPSKYR